jgi:hypothetical protein
MLHDAASVTDPVWCSPPTHFLAADAAHAQGHKLRTRVLFADGYQMQLTRAGVSGIKIYSPSCAAN